MRGASRGRSGRFSGAQASTMPDMKAGCSSKTNLVSMLHFPCLVMSLHCTPFMRSFFCSLEPFNNMSEGSLEVKLPTIWTDEKQSREEAERRERLEERRAEEKESEERRYRCAKR